MFENFTYLSNTTDSSVIINGLEYNYEDGKLDNIVDAYDNKAEYFYNDKGNLSEIRFGENTVKLETDEYGKKTLLRKQV